MVAIGKARFARLHPLAPGCEQRKPLTDGRTCLYLKLLERLARPASLTRHCVSTNGTERTGGAGST
jgi:hypothetical protein